MLRRSHSALGVVAAGHPATAEAASEVLKAGGNAFDAAIAAHFAACVAEPSLASLGGGGFMTARRADGEVVVYDFFAQTPSRKNRGELDFTEALCDFGGATQEFHLGMASIAVPGAIKGQFAIHHDLGSMPMARLVEPAVALAENGVETNAFQAEIQGAISPILLATPASRELFGGSPQASSTLAAGERFRVPELAAFLRQLAREGEDLFYRGELASTLAAACAEGGHLRRVDLRRYRVERRPPARGRFLDARFATNPAPSVGGVLIAFALDLLAACDLDNLRFGSAEHLCLLLEALFLTNHARDDAEVDVHPNHRACEKLLSWDYRSTYEAILRRHAESFGGTTHISVADRHGDLATMTLSNGEGSGYVLPGTGIMLNNMLGEADLSPRGFHLWPRNSRMASMMSPTVVERAEGSLLALGTGGSRRIRSAIVETLFNVLALGLALEPAIESPRLHIEDGVAHLEPGFAPDAVAALGRHAEDQRDLPLREWSRKALYFGGVHAIRVGADRRSFEGVGDPRRGGVAIVVE